MSVPGMAANAARAAVLFGGLLTASSPVLEAQSTISGQVAILEKGGDRADDLDHTVIYLEPAGGPKLKVAPTNTSIALQARQFAPRVRIVSEGSKIEFPNQDPFTHNVFSKAPQGPFDTESFGKAKTRDNTFRSAGVYPLYCNVHPKMTAFVIAVRTPYFTQAGDDGKFAIERVPAGRYVVHIWHDRPIAKQLCRALEVAHDEGVIHRDIKPQNMVVQPDGVLKVMDFGIARLAERPPSQGHTKAGMIVGTPDYMSPEQLFSEELDARADLYSAGVVIYRCLTGRLPYEASTAFELMAKVVEESPPTPHDLEPDIPVSLSDLVMQIIAKERERRPRAAVELHDLLDKGAWRAL